MLITYVAAVVAVSVRHFGQATTYPTTAAQLLRERPKRRRKIKTKKERPRAPVFPGLPPLACRRLAACVLSEASPESAPTPTPTPTVVSPSVARSKFALLRLRRVHQVEGLVLTKMDMGIVQPDMKEDKSGHWYCDIVVDAESML